MADSSSAEGWHRPWLVVPVVTATAAALMVAATGLPRADGPLPPIARHAVAIALPRWGTTEIVSEIVYGSRGWDTFGETFLLLAAVLSVGLLARNREPRREYVGEASAGRAEQSRTDPQEGADAEESEARAAEEREEDDAPDRSGGPAPDHADDDPLGAPAPERAAGMTVLVRVGTRLALPVLAVAAVYLAAWGYTPGGGFPAGAALSGIAVLVYAAFGHRTVSRLVRPDVLEPVEMFGAGLIIAAGVVGMAARGSFLDNWLPLVPQQMIRSGGTLQVFSGAELVEVASGLTIAIFALLGMGHDWSPDESGDDGRDAGGRA